MGTGKCDGRFLVRLILAFPNAGFVPGTQSMSEIRSFGGWKNKNIPTFHVPLQPPSSSIPSWGSALLPVVLSNSQPGRNHVIAGGSCVRDGNVRVSYLPQAFSLGISPRPWALGQWSCMFKQAWARLAAHCTACWGSLLHVNTVKVLRSPAVTYVTEHFQTLYGHLSWDLLPSQGASLLRAVGKCVLDGVARSTADKVWTPRRLALAQSQGHTSLR